MKRRIHHLIKKALNDVVHGGMDKSVHVLPENRTTATAYDLGNNEYSVKLTLRGDDVPEVK